MMLASWVAMAVIGTTTMGMNSGERMGFRVEGEQILTPDGKPIFFRGYNSMWWVAPSDEHIGLMRDMGANMARAMFGYSTPERKKSTVDEVVRLVKSHTDQGLWVIPVVHDFRINGKAPYDDPGVNRKFLEMWRDIVMRLKDDPKVGAWEPINEPHNSTPERVGQWYTEVIREFRKWDPHRPIVVEGADWSWPEDLVDSLVQKDPQVIYSFHTYGPWDYVAQNRADQIVYPGKWSRTTLADAIRPAVEFRAKHRVPVWCGEWGVHSGLPGAFQWITDVHSVLEEFRLPWTYWAWAEKPENPLHDTFDVNPKKAELYAHMQGVFARSIQLERRRR